MSRVLLSLVLGLLLLTGCRDEEAEARFRSPLGPVAATPQRPGDPAKGRDALLNAPYVSCGMPMAAYERLAPAPEPSDLIPGRTGRNATLPYALTAHVAQSGVEVVSSNCLTCHAQEIAGEVVVGLGNEFADFTRDPRRLALQAGRYVTGAAETAEWQHWADRLEGIAPYIGTRTIGVNPAPNLTWALMAHRDPRTLAWSPEPRIAPPPADPLPISVPPWWGMARKNAMFYTTIGRGDQAHFMLLASMLCVEDPDELTAIDAYAADIRAFILSLEPPDWPYAIDADLARTGAGVYARACDGCHGTPGGAYPNRVIALEEVGTDPAYAAESTDGSRDRFFDWVAASPYGDENSAAPARGYIAPPLDGVWATAPYLHNGAVPSLAALLDSRRRPAFWRHEIPRVFDPQAVGWRHEALASGQAAEPDAGARRRIYDTTFRGYGKGGHSYADGLDEAERLALLEYLKTF